MRSAGERRGAGEEWGAPARRHSVGAHRMPAVPGWAAALLLVMASAVEAGVDAGASPAAAASAAALRAALARGRTLPASIEVGSVCESAGGGWRQATRAGADRPPARFRCAPVHPLSPWGPRCRCRPSGRTWTLRVSNGEEAGGGQGHGGARPSAAEPRRAAPPSPGVAAADLALRVHGDDWLPLTLFTPPPSFPRPVPALILAHATGGGRGSLATAARAAAARGYAVATPDARWHGGWLSDGGKDRAAARGAYGDALVAGLGAAPGGAHPFLLDSVWDAARVLDWLSTLPDIDPARFGATGVSLGGMQAWLLAAADARVAAAAPLIGVQSFAYAADHDAWRARAASIGEPFAAAAAKEGKAEPDAATFRAVLGALAPGLLDAYDAPASIAAVAPRPFLAVNGADDPRCPAAGVRRSFDAAAAAYRAGNASDALKLILEPGVGHEVTPGMAAAAFGWLDRWLGVRVEAGRQG